MANHVTNKLSGAIRVFKNKMSESDHASFIRSFINSNYRKNPLILKPQICEEAEAWSEMLSEEQAATVIIQKLHKDERGNVENILLRCCTDEVGVRNALSALNESLKWRKTMKQRAKEISQGIRDLSVGE